MISLLAAVSCAVAAAIAWQIEGKVGKALFTFNVFLVGFNIAFALIRLTK